MGLFKHQLPIQGSKCVSIYQNDCLNVLTHVIFNLVKKTLVLIKNTPKDFVVEKTLAFSTIFGPYCGLFNALVTHIHISCMIHIFTYRSDDLTMKIISVNWNRPKLGPYCPVVVDLASDTKHLGHLGQSVTLVES